MKRFDFLTNVSVGASLAAFAGPSAADAANARTGVDPRADAIFERRIRAARADRDAFALSAANGDEERFADRGYLASFTKGLPHDGDGRVERAAFAAFVRAVSQRDPSLLDERTAKRLRRTVTYTLTDASCVAGCDPYGLQVAAAPRLQSPEQAREAREVAWHALTRDVPFARYATDPTIDAAARDLQLTPETLFRAPFATTGPYVSQFLYRDVAHPVYGSLAPRATFPMAGRDYLTDRATWLQRQNGLTIDGDVPRATPGRFVATARDLADWADRSGATITDAALMVRDLAPESSQAHRYVDVLGLLGLATDVAAIGVFHQKFAIHRRLRPEALFGLIDGPRTDVAFDASLTSSAVLDRLYAATGTYLLPQAHPNGSPQHPSYPAAHAMFAGAAITILKAFVSPTATFERPVTASADGATLVPYAGAPLTIVGELDKLAFNFSYARHADGVHYRSDSDAGLRMGEAAALSVLRDAAAASGSTFGLAHITTFDGMRATVTA